MMTIHDPRLPPPDHVGGNLVHGDRFGKLVGLPNHRVMTFSERPRVAKSQRAKRSSDVELTTA
ncbi:MAG: hypothetical protein AAGJ40_02540 [Planctomycetota bacterium]